MPLGDPTRRWRESENFRTKIGMMIGPTQWRESWIRFAALSWRPFSQNPSPCSLGFRAMVRQAESPRRNVRRSCASSSPPGPRTPRVNLPSHRPPHGGKHLHGRNQCRAQTALPRRRRASCPMGTRATTSSLSFGERRSACPLPIRI